MKRRHLLALVILALVVATVIAVGPVRVWDALTLRTVEDEYWPNGQIKLRLRLRLWESNDPGGWRRDFRYSWGDDMRCDVDAWFENGQKSLEIRKRQVERLRGWSEAGQLLALVVAGTGISTTGTSPTGEISEQTRYRDDVIVETRTSPPWFTEEEILQSVEGVEESQ